MFFRNFYRNLILGTQRTSQRRNICTEHCRCMAGVESMWDSGVYCGLLMIPLIRKYMLPIWLLLNLSTVIQCDIPGRSIPRSPPRCWSWLYTFPRPLTTADEEANLTLYVRQNRTLMNRRSQSAYDWPVLRHFPARSPTGL